MLRGVLPPHGQSVGRPHRLLCRQAAPWHRPAARRRGASRHLRRRRELKFGAHRYRRSIEGYWVVAMAASDQPIRSLHENLCGATLRAVSVRVPARWPRVVTRPVPASSVGSGRVTPVRPAAAPFPAQGVVGIEPPWPRPGDQGHRARFCTDAGQCFPLGVGNGPGASRAVNDRSGEHGAVLAFA